MREGWKEVKLGDFVYTNRQNINKSFGFEKITYLDISSVGTGEISFNEEINLNEAPSRAKRIVDNGDVIVSSVRPGNRNFAYIKNKPKNLVVSTGFTSLHVKKEVLDNRFLYYLISDKSFTEYLVSVEKGANYPAVTSKDFEDALILLPPLPTQQRIAEILSDYDDLIENNLKRIKILEEMAQQTYEEWFVRMRFPGHESAVINPETGLPEGWEKNKLSLLLEFQRGFDLPINNRQDGCIPVYASTGIIGYHNLCKIKGPNLITGRSGTLGKVQLVLEDAWPLNTTLWVKKFNLGTPIFSMFLLRNLDLSRFGGGVAVPSLDRNVIHSLRVVIPNKSLINRFENFVTPIYQLKSKLEYQNQRLREARDILLPRLMMGMIDVTSVVEKPTKAKIIPLQKPKKEASQQFKEAVLIACLTERFGSEKYPLGRKRYTKLSYLFHRYSDNKIQDYLRKAAGPYNPKTKYAGPEKIALQNKYIQHWKGEKGTTGFVSAEKIEDALNYFPNYWNQEDLAWLIAEYKFKSNDELELLATVDNSLVELSKKKIEFTANNVMEIIKSEKEWEAKLERTIFSDANVERAIGYLTGILKY